VVSFTLRDISPSEAGLRLDEESGLLCRVGLHCAPLAHRTIGTFPQGTIRFGLGAFNTSEEIEEAVRAVYQLTKRS
jgi:selenocysteine lyase/cysteine desulfurase